MMTELPWIYTARSYIGLKETVGPKTNSVIASWLVKLKAWWADDETPWCGTFVATCLLSNDRYVIKNWYRALEWNNGGTKLNRPAYGCIVTFSRQGGGHVGFCVGKDKQGQLMILGGNQNNSVSISPFEVSRVNSYVWPHRKGGTPSYPDTMRFNLPLVNSLGLPSSENEA